MLSSLFQKKEKKKKIELIALMVLMLALMTTVMALTKTLMALMVLMALKTPAVALMKTLMALMTTMMALMMTLMTALKVDSVCAIWSRNGRKLLEPDFSNIFLFLQTPISMHIGF